MLTAPEVIKIRNLVVSETKELPVAFGALSDLVRFRIFKILIRHKDVCVTDVAKVFGISIPAASYQLKVLERSGLAKRIRMGQMVCYEVNEENPLVKMLMTFVKKAKQRSSH